MSQGKARWDDIIVVSSFVSRASRGVVDQKEIHTFHFKCLFSCEKTFREKKKFNSKAVNMFGSSLGFRGKGGGVMKS